MTIAIRRPLFALATSDRFERAVRATSQGEALAYRLASRYVAGRTVEDAFATARRLADRGVLSSIDFFGERVTDPIEADRVADAYVSLAGRLERGSRRRVSVGRPLAPRARRARRGRAPAARADRCRAARGCAGPGRGRGGARGPTAILETVLAVARAGGAVSATVQANLRRSVRDAEVLAEAGVPIRLVKGAYVESPAAGARMGRGHRPGVRRARAPAAAGRRHRVAGHARPVLREALLPAMPGVGVEMLLGVRPDDQAGARRAGHSGPRVRAVRRKLVPLRDAAGRRVAWRQGIGRIRHSPGRTASGEIVARDPMISIHRAARR